MQPLALVTPASRGIGLELARRLLQTTHVPVVATARKHLDQTKENVLTGLKDVNEDRLHVLQLDVLDEESISTASSHTSHLFPKKTHYLHLALCIPGILYPEKSPSQIDATNALSTFQTNTLGPLLLLKHFSPYLPRKSTKLEPTAGLPTRATWANMSARVGSITDNALGGWYSYRASKAGVNQATKTFDNFLKTSAGENAMAISLHPGTVKTGLSKEFWGNVKEEKLFSPEFAAEKLMEVVNTRKIEDRGRCWDWKGEEVPP
ncbi:short-chain dehydrogenase reductase like protein [Teratosphaeria destructans]|uniref:Short-chain dehydrogenase reductase like protein n=1 Tax=Teratosphaeria destructans TaxID=418781 RepID=A0A9W7T3X3_9PEZI|nr:short-chain dehydrogenase reductase like protein [Teratosphaeria destructans]